jgi:IclR family transcriptional regulator, pca regulon regulatory protein
MAQSGRSSKIRLRGGHMPRVKPSTLKVDDNGEWVQSVPVLRESRYSQSVERGLAILACFTPERPVRGIADIADELGMSRSTTHRYAITLVALGYLVQGAKRKYQLGLAVIDLGMAALNGTSLREHAQPYLEELSRRTGYTTNLAILDGPEILYVGRVRGLRPRQRNIDLGLAPSSRLPIHCTAMGKLLLAFLPEQEQRAVISEMRLFRRGPNTITSKTSLSGELKQIREEGMAVNDQELAPDLYSIAAPVRNSCEVVAAVNIAAHNSMIDLERLVSQLGPHLISTTDRISARLGYRRHDELAYRGNGCWNG